MRFVIAQRRILWFALLATAVLLSACSPSLTSQADEMIGLPTAVSLLTATPPPPATTTTPPTPTLMATATAAPTATPSPTLEPEPTLPPSDLAACGLLLPLVSEPYEGLVTAVNGRLPADLPIPDTVRPALDYLLQNPADVGLVAYRIGFESEGVYLNADAPMPLASVVKLIHLVAYAAAVENGRLDPATWLPVSELERFFLPGSDLRAHPDAIAQLTERGLVSGDPPAFPLEELPWMMLRNSSNAATDYLHLLLGQETIENTAIQLGLESQTAPCPFLGQFLTISNHTRRGDNEAAIQSLIADPAAYGRLVMDLTAAYSDSADFRAAEGRWYQRSRRPTWEAQSLFSEQLNAQGSARDYADLMATIAQNELGSAYLNFLVRRNLEWPMSVYPINQELFSTVGYKNGTLPGILNTLYYAAPREGGGLVVVALFFRHLPEATYQQWRRDLPHDDLARWLLTEPRAIPALRQALGEG
jgi:D-alanyl-D-alanine carboxypeptidase